MTQKHLGPFTPVDQKQRAEDDADTADSIEHKTRRRRTKSRCILNDGRQIEANGGDKDEHPQHGRWALGW